LNILTSDVLVPVYGVYENLVVSSVGLKRFNLLGSSSSSRASVSSLGCVMSFSRYLVLKLVIFALTVGICRSVCKIVLRYNHRIFVYLVLVSHVRGLMETCRQNIILTTRGFRHRRGKWAMYKKHIW
jgi:hypothetical protein